MSKNLVVGREEFDKQYSGETFEAADIAGDVLGTTYLTLNF